MKRIILIAIVAAFLCSAPLALAGAGSEAPPKSSVDGCGAYKFKSLIGMPINAVPPDGLPEQHRIYYVGGDEGMTRDLVWTRLTIIVWTDGKVSDVYCG